MTGTAEEIARRARDILRAVAAQRLARYTAEVSPFLDALPDI